MRPARGGPPWHYEGKVATAGAEFALTAIVSAGGEIAVSAGSSLPEGAAEKARLLLRAAWKHARSDAAPPPRRLVRWRA